MSLMPTYLIGALLALVGVCIGLCVTIFHYFKDRVDEHIREKMQKFFSSSSTNELVGKIRKGSLPKVVTRDFSDDLFRITGPRRRLRTLFLLFPVDGCLFMLTAFFAIFASSESGFIPETLQYLEYVANLLLMIAIILFIYCSIELVLLTRELS